MISLARPSLQILGKTQTGYFRFLNFWSNPYNDIDIKLGLVTELDKRDAATSKNFDDDFMWANYEVIVTVPIYPILSLFHFSISIFSIPMIHLIQFFSVIHPQRSPSAKHTVNTHLYDDVYFAKGRVEESDERVSYTRETAHVRKEKFSSHNVASNGI